MGPLAQLSLPLQLLAVIGLLERRWALVGATFPPSLCSTRRRRSCLRSPSRSSACPVVRDRKLPRGWAAVMLLGIVAVLLMVWAYRSDDGADFGPKITRDEAPAMPEFGPEDDRRSSSTTPSRSGSAAVERASAVPDRGRDRALGLATLAWRRPRWWPPALWAVLAASIVAFVLAHATLFTLHMPNRYVAVPLPIVLSLGGAILVDRALEATRTRRRAHAGRAPTERSSGAPRRRHATRGIAQLERQARDGDPRGLVATIAFLQTLPKSTLVAAHPIDADPIPMRARRSVLASYETAIPYWLGYYDEEKRRLVASLDACYASSWAK